MNKTDFSSLTRAAAAVEKPHPNEDEVIGVKPHTDFVEGKSMSVSVPLLNQPPEDGIFFSKPRNFKPVKTAVGCYIQNHKNEILWLFRKKDQKWCVPGGTLNENETHLQAIRREIEEETGLKLDIKEINFYGTCYLVHKAFHLVWHIYAYQELEPFKEQPVILEPEVHSKCEWLPLNRIETKDCMLGTEECLKFLQGRGHA